MANDKCDFCDVYRSRGDPFCSSCGANFEDVPVTAPPEDDTPKESGRNRAIFQCGLAVTIACGLILIFEAFTAFFRSGYVFSNLSDYSTSIILITPNPTAIFTISGIAVQIYYILLLIAMVLSVGYLLYKAIGPLWKFNKDRDPEPLKDNVLFKLATLFAAIYFIQLAFIFILVAAGMDLDDSVPLQDEPVWELMFLLLEASVWEEIISRVLLIGVPMLIVALIVKQKDTKWWRFLLGGYGMSRTALVFIIFSALMFGLAHIPGWAPWKFVPTFLMGLVLGYLFVRFGLYAAIAMHFLTDYLQSSDWLLGDGGAILSLIIILVALLGIPYIWLYSKSGISYTKNALESIESPKDEG